MKTQTENIIKRRALHHKALETISTLPSPDGLAIWRKLRKIERIAHDAATASCNGERFTCKHGTFDFCSYEVSWDNFSDAIEQDVKGVLGAIPDGFVVNGDARGHALKIRGREAGYAGAYIPEGMEKDCGSNGLLAPEIN